MTKIRSATTSARRSYAGFTKTANASKYNRSTVLLAILFVIGLGWMIYLTSQVVPYAPTDDETQRDAITKIGLQDMQSRLIVDEGFAKGLSAFYYDASLRQMPIETLSRNPFLHVSPKIVIVAIPENTGTETKDPTGTGGEETKPVVEKPKAPPTDGFKLSMILIMNGNPEAVINGKVVNVGTPIGDQTPIGGETPVGEPLLGAWVVERIETSKVTLRWNGQRHVLKMNRPKEGDQ
jgi:hypothetical protein